MPPRVLWLAVAFSAGCSGLQQHDRLPVRPQPRRALLRSAASVALALAARPPVARGVDQAALFGMQSLMEDAAKKVPANAGVELLGDWTIESGKDAGGQRSVRAYKNSRSAVVSGADPRGEALLFRKGVLGCCGFNGVEEASLTVVSVPPGEGDIFGVFDVKTQKLNFDDGSVWKLKPCTGPFQTPTERKACEAAQ